MNFGLHRKKPVNETVWVAYSNSDPSLKKNQATPAKLSTVDRRTLDFTDIFFGSLGILFAVIAGLGWFKHSVSIQTPLLVGGFFIAVIALAHLTLDWKNPLAIFLLHVVVVQSVCALNLLYVRGPFFPWWQPYLLACVFGVLTIVLATQKAQWGLMLSLSYILHFLLITFFFTPMDWPVFLIRAGLIATLGLVVAQAMSLLSLSMTHVHERSVKLRLSKDELEQIDRVKTDFFNNISHEFRTPITLTLGPIQGMLVGRYGAIPESAKQQLKMMTSQQQRLLQLINQILDVAKLEAGLAELHASRLVDFNAYVSTRAEQFRPLSEQKGINLKVSPDPQVAGKEVYVDLEKFDKVLINLLSNAHKFTKAGSIEVSTQHKGNRVAVKVSDTGMGIRADQLTHIFDRFKQAEGSTSAEVSGTGLGLSLVQEYSHLHGGEVSVNSVFGHGTTFEIVLPIGKGHLTESQITSDPMTRAEMPQGQLALASATAQPNLQDEISESDSNKPRVLYVDDHPELRKYVRGVLKDRYNVFLAVDGKDGLTKAREIKPDLILSDLMMPVMDGTEFCRKVREDLELKSIPFVLLTAKAELDSKIEGLEIGADDYLAKPFSESELLARVKNLVILRQQQVRLKRELQAAAAIQQSLLPKALSKKEYIIDYLHRSSEELSGDFCDVIPQADWVYAYVVDVTSHGTASAQVTYLLKEIFRESIAQKPDGDLNYLMETVAKKYSGYGLEYDVALQFFRYNPGTKALEYLRGSSPSPLRVTATGEHAPMVVQPGPSLSSRFSGSSRYALLQKTLDPGDKVYLFTDGCYEFSEDRQEFSLKHFYPLLSTLQQEDWQKEILDRLTSINKSPVFPDDLTILRLRIL